MVQRTELQGCLGFLSGLRALTFSRSLEITEPLSQACTGHSLEVCLFYQFLFDWLP